MTRTSSLIALCAAVAISATTVVPEWIHLLPAGEIRTVDGRGPYKALSLQAIADASLPAGAKLPLDENHSIDKAAPHGQASPARGWIVELQAREDGLWGRVEWTPQGQAIMEDRSYAGISPAILHTQDMRVIKIVRASLTNTPNLQGLTALHSEEDGMNYKAKLLASLGLGSEADDAAIDAAISAQQGGTALHSVNLLEHPTFVALQAENAALATNFTALQEGIAKDKATAFVDAAIAAGHVGVKPAREDYIALHMSDPAKAEKMIGVLPKVGGMTSTGDLPPENGERGLDATDRQVMSLFGVDEEAYKAGLTQGGLNKETL